VSLD